MKWLIASDIHGSAYYCEKLTAAVHREQPDKIILLGDLLYHGPRNNLPLDYAPKRVIEMLNSLSPTPLCVRGNCDSEVDGMVLSFPANADYALLYDGTFSVFATHGHLFSPDSPPPLSSGDILLTGHTHVPACEKHGEFIYINPGSVSIPKENSPHSYMLSENGVFSWKKLDGETYKTYKGGAAL